MVEIVPASAYPAPDDIKPMNNDVVINFDDVRKSLQEIRNGNHKTAPSDMSNENERDGKTNISHTISCDVGSGNEKHEPAGSQIDETMSTTERIFATPKSPTSIYVVGGSNKHPKLELKNREVSTRQCKFEICEEWEQFQIIRDKSVSCPPSPLIGRKHDIIDNVGRINPGYAASEPGAEIDQDLTGQKSKDPFPFHFLFTSAGASPLKECHIIPNPYNKANQRFHSTLQCPCFLFFFFLCCLPAVHLMQQSDRQFKMGNNKRAKNYGVVSTMCYIVGTVIGVTFLVLAIFFAADYVKQFL